MKKYIIKHNKRTNMKLILWLFSILILSSIAFAQTSTITPFNDILKGRDGNLVMSCENQQGLSLDFCTNSTICRINIYYPNSSLLIYNKRMTNNVSFFNLSLSPTESNYSGSYTTTVQCCDGSFCGIGYSKFKILPYINEAGTEDTILITGACPSELTGITLIGILVAFSLVLLYFGIKFKLFYITWFSGFFFIVLSLYINACSFYIGTFMLILGILILIIGILQIKF